MFMPSMLNVDFASRPWVPLGRSKITTQFTGVSSNAIQDVTGLSFAATIPSWASQVRVELNPFFVSSTVAGGNAVQTFIREGSTTLGGAYFINQTPNYSQSPSVLYEDSVTPGSHTYKASISNSGTAVPSMGAAATTPSILTVSCR